MLGDLHLKDDVMDAFHDARDQMKVLPCLPIASVDWPSCELLNSGFTEALLKNRGCRASFRPKAALSRC